MRRRDIWWRSSFAQLYKAASNLQLHYQRVIKRHQHMQPEQQGHNSNRLKISAMAIKQRTRFVVLKPARGCRQYTRLTDHLVGQRGRQTNDPLARGNSNRAFSPPETTIAASAIIFFQQPLTHVTLQPYKRTIPQANSPLQTQYALTHTQPFAAVHTVNIAALGRLQEMH